MGIPHALRAVLVAERFVPYDSEVRRVLPLLSVVGMLAGATAEAKRPRADSSRAKPAVAPAGSPSTGARGPKLCDGEYAEDLAVLSPTARTYEDWQPPYTFCIRTSAVYECPSYAPDGTLRRDRRTVTAHGTGFGLRRQGDATLIVTNEHVASWPAVTDGDHKAEEVPAGCRRISESVRIVDNENDDYGRDDVPLTRVVVDPQLDLAVLKAASPLGVMPWRIGRSAALRDRVAVMVRGFPLGVLRATSVGKVINAHDHDDVKEWNHDDFVVDALLSQGNSGSPVFAVSCRTGELELMGVFHAAYARGSALNVVVGIDQARDLLTSLTRAPRPQADRATLDASERARLVAAAKGLIEPFFPFGPLTAAVRARSDGALVFEVMPRDFPVRSWPLLVLEDLPGARPEDFGARGRIWAGNRHGLCEVPGSALDAEAMGTLDRLLASLRRDAALALRYRAAAQQGGGTRQRFDEMSRLEKTLRRAAADRNDLAQSAAELADRLCPYSADGAHSLAEALAVPRPPSVAQHSAAHAEVATPSPVAVPAPPATAPAVAPAVTPAAPSR